MKTELVVAGYIVHDNKVLLPAHIDLSADQMFTSVSGGVSTTTGEISLHELERRALEKALLSSDYNKSKAARKLKISRDTLRYRLKKHGLG